MSALSPSCCFPLGPFGVEPGVEDPLVSSSEILLSPDAAKKTVLEVPPKAEPKCGVQVEPERTESPDVEEDFAASVEAYDSSYDDSEWDSYEDRSP